MLIEKHTSIRSGGAITGYIEWILSGIIKEFIMSLYHIGLNILRRMKKLLPAGMKYGLYHLMKLTKWCIDFMNDSLWDGREVHLLNILDNCKRELLWIKADTS